ncbi:hypothetical protein E2636_14425 [Paenisporosarcina antarctica]|uniref:Uncharacterized protein n=1 Tax=Paenisporosarcina antarctica TaxID=417367 RepID=A0A4P7A0U4_9BACL|nr:hypothetical protein E2636_14425 [Paenisporosarcina antarctica]
MDRVSTDSSVVNFGCHVVITKGDVVKIDLHVVKIAVHVVIGKFRYFLSLYLVVGFQWKFGRGPRNQC